MKKLTTNILSLITAALMIIASLICFYVLHLPDNGYSQYLVLAIYLTGIVYQLYIFHQKQSNPSFKAYFNEGFKFFVLITLALVIYSWIFYKFNPQIMEEGIASNNEMLRTQGNKTEAEIAANAEQLRKIYLPVMISLTTIKYLFLGALSTAVTTVVLLRKK